jgi:hypothetical protein
MVYRFQKNPSRRSSNKREARIGHPWSSRGAITKMNCYTCHVTFDTWKELRAHKKNHCKTYQCPHCEQEPYSSETFYKYHLLTHSDRWPELEKDTKALEAAKRRIRLDREKYRRIADGSFPTRTICAVMFVPTAN